MRKEQSSQRPVILVVLGRDEQPADQRARDLAKKLDLQEITHPFGDDDVYFLHW